MGLPALDEAICRRCGGEGLEPARRGSLAGLIRERCRRCRGDGVEGRRHGLSKVKVCIRCRALFQDRIPSGLDRRHGWLARYCPFCRRVLSGRPGEGPGTAGEARSPGPGTGTLAGPVPTVRRMVK